MKKYLRSFSVGSFAVGLALGIVGTSLGATRAGSSIFPDVPLGAYYDSAVGEMYGLGIITGFGDGTFKPDEGLTRGQAAVMMQRLRNEILGIETGGSSSSSARSRSSRSSSSVSSTSSSSSSSAQVSSTAPNAHGKFRFTTNAYRHGENDGETSVSIVRTGGNEGIAAVDYKLVSGTASGGLDFEAQEGTLLFQDEDTSKTFQVKLLDDADQEGDETFTLELSNATGGAEIIDPKVSTFTIQDDETVSSSSSAATESSGPEQGTFRYSAVAYMARESWESITIYVQRTGGTKGSVSVGYNMSDGTARNGTEYTKTSGTLSFADGEMEKTFTVTLDDNNDIGGNKTVNLTLTTPTGGAVLDEQFMTSLLTIFDDEVGAFGSGAFRFTESEYEVLESEGHKDIAVLRQGGAAGQATVQYKTSGGTAQINSDYKAAEGILTFRQGEMKKVFVVEVLEDLASDGGEAINLVLQSPTAATLASPSSATLYLY